MVGVDGKKCLEKQCLGVSQEGEALWSKTGRLSEKGVSCQNQRCTLSNPALFVGA